MWAKVKASKTHSKIYDLPQQICARMTQRFCGWVYVLAGGLVILQVVTLILSYFNTGCMAEYTGEGPADGCWAEFGLEAL